MLCQIQINFTLQLNGINQQRVDNTLQLAHTLIYILGNVINNSIRNIQAVPAYLTTQNILTQINIGPFQLSNQPPFETGQQTVFYPLQHHRSTVRSQNQLFTILMQMIEDMEKSILGFCHTGKLLNIINNQDINLLIKSNKVIEMISPY